MYKKVLVPLDGSELAEHVLPHAGFIARGCGAEEVILLEVVEPFNPPKGWDGSVMNPEEVRDIDRKAKEAAERYVQRVSDELTLEKAAVRGDVVTGKPGEAITEYAGRHAVDLIIIASHGRSGISRWLMGSVAEKVLRSSCVPVLIVRPPGCEPSL